MMTTAWENEKNTDCAIKRWIMVYFEEKLLFFKENLFIFRMENLTLNFLFESDISMENKCFKNFNEKFLCHYLFFFFSCKYGCKKIHQSIFKQ